MNKLAEVINPHGDFEENIERIVKILGRSKLRLQIFNAIYGKARKPKSVGQIATEPALKSMRRQSLLNEINYLSGRRIIAKTTIPAVGRNGTELAYGKIDFIMAHKLQILRGVAKPSLLKRSPTKRRPQVDVKVKGSTGRRSGVSRSSRAKLKVLYLTASPSSQDALRTDAEFQIVQNEIRGSKYRENIQLISSPAASTKSVLNGINDHRPQIVHFSGHGGGGSIWLDDGKVENSTGQSMDFGLLAETLGATSSPPILLVLNACDTLAGADVLLDAVKVVIAMSASISDIGAATFAAQFYAAIASGQPISAALKQGKIAMKAAALKDSHLPKIIHRKAVDPKLLKLTGRR